MVSLTLILSIFLLFISQCFGEKEQIYHVALNGDNTISLNWMLDYIKETLIFEIHYPLENNWFGIGFSNRGEQFPADYCIVWTDFKGKIHFHDVWADENALLHIDKQQNCKGFKIRKSGNIIKYTFNRKFDTCDYNDYIIEEGTTHVVWVKGKDRLYQINGLNISSSIGDGGMVRIQLLKNIKVKNELPSYVHTLDIFADKVKVSDNETTYWCHVHKLGDDFKNKHHIYQYESHIPKASEGLVHHMEVFHCEAPPEKEIPLYVGNCFDVNRPISSQVCKRVLAAWAMGAPAFIYPPEAGLPIGGINFNPYIMLEVHYNNPERKSGLIDSSGIRFYVSSKLKPMDAGVMELGLEYTDKMAIPPKQPLFSLIGYCVSECTAVSLPPEGITVFGSQLHTHLTGIRVYTRHIRDGIEMKELNRDNHFSTHFQEIRRLRRPVKVLPGDALITKCDYNTMDRENITLGGFAITDEMCVNYIHYFPATDLEVCKSSISDQALATYFNYMNEWEGEKTSLNKGISDNYKAINWNKMRVQLLNDVYKEAPLSMQCNKSSGDRFPGYWENIPITPILTPLPPSSRKC